MQEKSLRHEYQHSGSCKSTWELFFDNYKAYSVLKEVSVGFVLSFILIGARINSSDH